MTANTVKVGFIVRIGKQSSRISAGRHIHTKMRTVFEHKLVIVTVAIRSLGNVLEPIVIELS